MKNLIAFVAFLVLSIGGLKAQVVVTDVTLISQTIVNVGNEVMVSYVFEITDVDDNFVVQFHAPGTFFEQKAESISEDKITNLVTILITPDIKRQEIEQNLQRTYDFAQQ